MKCKDCGSDPLEVAKGGSVIGPLCFICDGKYLGKRIKNILAEAVHKAYCVEYEKKNGQSYHTKGDFEKLNLEQQAFDYAAVFAVVKTLNILGLLKGSPNFEKSS